jgi:hypothetical protein
MRLSNALVLAVAVVLFAACGDLDVKSIRIAESVPAQLQGEWTGTWHSTAATGAGSGTVVLRMQDFGGEPVVSIILANPCVEARPYQFRTSGNLVELMADGEVLFSALLSAETRTLTGSYSCANDSGVWHVAWTRELSPLVDLGGQWEGSVTVPGFPPQALTLVMDFVVQGGALTIQGFGQVPSLSSQALPLTGIVNFQDTTFDVRIQAPTAQSGSVGVLLIGSGDITRDSQGALVSARIDVGLVQTNDPALPFTQAVWRAVRVGP